jgi:hypothetical protein
MCRFAVGVDDGNAPVVETSRLSDRNDPSRSGECDHGHDSDVNRRGHHPELQNPERIFAAASHPCNRGGRKSHHGYEEKRDENEIENRHAKYFAL